MMRAAEWTGRVGETWAREWQRTDRSFAGLDAALEQAILAAAPMAGRLVDLGCGAGKTSVAIAEARPDAEIIGLDLSPDLIAVASGRAEGSAAARDHCRFVAGDATALLAALAPVDFLFSRHGVMFFDDPVAAFGRIFAAAVPGAGLVFSCFAAPTENPWAFETLAAVASPAASSPASIDAVPPPGPFAFADPERTRAIMTSTGWAVDTAPRKVAFRYVAGGGVDPVADALSFFRRIGPSAAALREAPEAERSGLLDRLAAVCRRRCENGEVAFPAAAWLWRAHRQESFR